MGLTHRSICTESRVPLDEGRHRSESLHGRAVQGPDLIGHVSVVGIDADFALPNARHRVARQVKFLDDSPRNSVQIDLWVKPMIHSVDIDIVDVQQYSAAGLPSEGS